jgi:hypothetical protein
MLGRDSNDSKDVIDPLGEAVNAFSEGLLALR